MFPMRDVESCEGPEPRAIAFERHESGILRDKSFDLKVKKMGYFLNSLKENGVSVLPPRTEMVLNQYLDSPNKRFRLFFQEDSNLVLRDGGNPIWAANADVPYSTEVYPQRGMVAAVSLAYLNYSLGVSDNQRSRLWNSSNTSVPSKQFLDSAARTFLQLQDDGNIVIIEDTPIWASNTSIPVAPDISATMIGPGTMIYPNQSYTVGSSTLVFQGDGNLVLYGANGAVNWASYTEGKGAAVASMQEDGNFVIYDGAGTPLWHTHTAGQPGAYARIQDNGSFSIVYPKIAWARFGFRPDIKPIKVFYPNNGEWKTKDQVIYKFG
ncbi:putidacin L1 family lectin-like bacteriocin [Pseudomonas syringae]|nr:putidacin L1 family lectin-like bacteriocin [Pseudomonas syringae]